MNGIVGGINYNLLFPSGTASTQDAGTAILNALFSTAHGASAPSTFASTGNPLLDLKLAQKNEVADVAQEAKQPQVARAIDAFKTAVASAKTLQEALANPDVQNLLLTANNLTKYIGDTALVQKAFLSDPTDPKSIAVKLNDPAFLGAALTYNFAKHGLAGLQSESFVASVTHAYAEAEWRQSLNQATPGLANALQFLTQASSIKTAKDVLQNVVNFNVVTTALGIPQEIVNQDTTAQEAAITSRLDLTKLRNANYVTGITDQYLLIMQENSQSGTGTTTSLTALAVSATSLIV